MKLAEPWLGMAGCSKFESVGAGTRVRHTPWRRQWGRREPARPDHHSDPISDFQKFHLTAG